MTNVPSVPEIITVNSEALQTSIRDLLPSQNGFGSELQASNVIFPIIDLTATAEGSTLPVSLQQSLAFGSQTAFSANNGTDVIENSPGFYRIFGTSSMLYNVAGRLNTITITDGLATKELFRNETFSGGEEGSTVISFDFIVFLTAGDSISAVSNNVSATISGSSRQVATGDGTLVNPNGFPL